MKTPTRPLWFALPCLLISMGLTAIAGPPTIDYPPRSQSVIVRQLGAFGVIARGTAPLHYQWRKNGAPIAGATNDQLVLAHARFSDAGSYSVIVSNSQGSVVSVDAALTVNSPVAGDVDYGFTADGFIDRQVLFVTRQPDGKVLIAGDFGAVHGAPRGHIARLNADGSTDYTFMHGLSGANDSVYSVAVQSDGKVLIAGGFSEVNGVSRQGIARLNADGSLDIGFPNILSESIASVSSMAIQDDGKVVFGGFFTQVNGVSRGYIARINPDGTLDQSFLNGLSGADELVHSVALQGGKVVLGGFFSTVNGVPRNRIARLNEDGTLDNGFLSGQSGATGYGYSAVYSVAAQTDGKVLIGGYFTAVNGVSRTNLARLNGDGTLDSVFLNGAAGTDNTVYSVAIQADGKVLIGGSFTKVNGAARAQIARLNVFGVLDTGFLNGLSGPSYTVYSVAVQGDGRVLIGGVFTAVNGASRFEVARLYADGTLDDGFVNGSSGPNDGVSSLAVQPDGKVVIGGYFTTVQGVSRNHIARLNLDGTLDTDFLNGLAGPNETVTSLAMQSNGKVLIGGWFSTVNGVNRSHIARLNADGTLDTGFLNALAGANDDVMSVAVQSDDKVVIGGYFSAVNGVSRNGIARLNSDGTLDTGFPNGGLSGATGGGVAAVAVQGDGKVLIGGWFTAVNGVSRNRIARLNADGTLDTSFLGLSGPDAYVWSVAVQSGGKVLIGGDFTTVNGASRNRIARLNADATLDNGFLDGLSGANSRVDPLAVQTDGKVVIGGGFTTVNGTARQCIARLNPDGSLDTDFLNGLLGAWGGVYAVGLQSDGQVLIAGDFTGVNGGPAPNVARLWGRTPTLLVTSTNDSGSNSLRQALADSFEGAAITFATNLTGTIALNSELVIGTSLSIAGPGADKLTISGSGTNRVFIVPSGIVDMSGVTIANGSRGISNNATLSLTACAVAGHTLRSVHGNSGAGLFNGPNGVLTLNGCTISSNSIYSGSLSFLLGAGIQNSSSTSILRITNCTVTANRLVITNSPVEPAIGGGLCNGGIATVVNCTISGNACLDFTDHRSFVFGGGIANYGASATLALGNVIVADNITTNAAGESLGPDCYGSFASLGYNLVGKTNGSSGWVASDLVGSIANPLNPLLGPLQNNGGTTFTHALLAGSPALDKGSSSIVDQQQTSGPNITGGPDEWQSFTAGASGSLLRVGIGTWSSPASPSTSPGTIRIYADEGTGGALLATASVTFANLNGLQIFSIPSAPALTAGNQYTIRFTVPSAPVAWVLVDGSNPYSGGRAQSGASYDYVFRTYVLPQTTDQRGRARPFDFSALANASGGDGSDIGAFELTLPSLNISRLPNQVVLSWSTNEPGYMLESITALPGSPNAWIAVPGTPAVLGSQYIQTNSPVFGNKYFRLRR